MPLTVDEAAIPLALFLCCCALLALLAVRACLYAVARMLVFYGCTFRTSIVECVVLTLSFSLFYICLSFNSGISCLTCALSVCAAAVLGWSAGSFRVLCVACFAVLSVIVPMTLSRGVEVVVTPHGRSLWVSRYAGENVRWNVSQAPTNTTTPSCVDGTELFIYHDQVSFAESTSTHGGTHVALGHTMNWVRPALGLPRRRPSQSRDEDLVKNKAAASADSACPPVRLLYSSGDGTVVQHYGAAPQPPLTLRSGRTRMDRIALLGEDNLLEDVVVRCLASKPEADSQNFSLLASATEADTPPTTQNHPCLLLNPATQLRHVRLEVYASAVDTALLCVAHIDDARDCASAAVRLEHSTGSSCGRSWLAAQVLRCLDPTSELDSLEHALKVVAAPAAFRQAMPTTAALRRVLPAQAVKLKAFFVLVMDGVVAPVGRALGTIAPVVAHWLAEASKWVLSYLEALWPHVQGWCASAARVAGGFLCGAAPAEASLPTDAAANDSAVSAAGNASTTTLAGAALTATPPPIGPPHSRSRFCQSAAGSVSWEYALGAHLRQSLSSALAATVDALEVVPGVWSAYRWAWNSEVTLTLGCLRALRATVRFLVQVLPLPLARATLFASRAALRLGAALAATVDGCVRRLSASSLIAPLRKASQWLLEQEWREVQFEWHAVRLIVGSGVRWGVEGTRVIWWLCSILCSVLRYVFALYSSTSLTIHLVVVMAQTAVLLVSMRDEIKALMRREEEESRRRAHAEDTNALLAPTNIIARLWVRKVERHTAVTRLQGIMLFVKSYHVECVQYALFHLVAFATLLGFSFLPFTHKLYRLTLHVVVPWYSSYLYLCFRGAGTHQPARRQVLRFTLAKMLVTLVLQRTVGDFLFRLLRDLCIALGFLGLSVLIIWAWPHRHRLFREVTEAIAESLNPTPQRAAPPPGSSASPALRTPMQPRASSVEDASTSLEEHPSGVNEDRSVTGGHLHDADNHHPLNVARTILVPADDSPARGAVESGGSVADPLPAGVAPTTTALPTTAASHGSTRPSQASSGSSSLFSEGGYEDDRAEL